MGIRDWLRERKYSFYKRCSPKAIIRIQKCCCAGHRSVQFFRYHLGGRFVYVLLLVLTLIAIVASQVIRYFLSINSINWTAVPSYFAYLLSFEGIWKVVLFYLVILVVYWLLKSRSFLVIEDFEDYTGTSCSDKGKGIAQLLLVELNRINQLYSDVEEQRPISTSIGPAHELSAVLKVDDPGEFGTSVSTSSTITVGSFAIPFGPLISLFNSISRGPRIRGSIRKGDDDSLLIVASSTGFSRNYGWKVSSKISPENLRIFYPEDVKESKDLSVTTSASEKTESATSGTLSIPSSSAKTVAGKNDTSVPCLSVERMVAELACRIMTDIPTTGSFRWEATLLFNKGLRKYRECLRTPKEQTANYWEAEACFQKALVFDTKFTTAWYNLGVVYSELGLKTAAEKAFSKVIEQDPNDLNAYHGLALTCYTRTYWRKIDSASQSLEKPTAEECENKILPCCNQVICALKGLDRP
ncbi:MAG: tetratricopeptide repeat protein, partial [Smithella sp.]